MLNKRIHTIKDIDGQWKNVRANANRASSVHETKAEAVAERSRVG